jgi:hypothetical protein
MNDLDIIKNWAIQNMDNGNIHWKKTMPYLINLVNDLIKNKQLQDSL